MKNKKAIICGSFNPFHEGHLFLLKKALKKYSHIYLIIAQNPTKQETNKITLKKNITTILEHNNLINHTTILINEGLLANYIKQLDTNIIIRGFRNFQDLKYELYLKKQYLDVNPNIVFKLYCSPLKLRKVNSTKIRKNL